MPATASATDLSRSLYRDDELRLEIVAPGPRWSFDGDCHLVKLATEAGDSMKRFAEFIPTQAAANEADGFFKKAGLLDAERTCRRESAGAGHDFWSNQLVGLGGVAVRDLGGRHSINGLTFDDLKVDAGTHTGSCSGTIDRREIHPMLGVARVRHLHPKVEIGDDGAG